MMNQGIYLFPTESILKSEGTKTFTCTCSLKEKCTSPGKHPLKGLLWVKSATTEPKIFSSLTRNKQVNYAVATGRLSPITKKYLVVVDIDQKDHELLKTLPSTFKYTTGSGGFHYWFWSKIPVSNSQGILPKVDIRGTNGYVLVPPSKHISGKEYTLDSFSNPILDLPKEIEDLLGSKPITGRIKSSLKTCKKSLRANKSSWWSTATIAEINKSIFVDGKQVPVGVRNSTLHRLLASERGKGVCNYLDIVAKSNMYVSKFEDRASFSSAEELRICSSVMKYPAYLQDPNLVNESYCKWMEKTHDVKFDLTELEQMDNVFFSKLSRQEKGKNVRTVSLKELTKLREEWIKAQDFSNHATYKSQLLAKKLISLGFEKQRTAKSNSWLIDVSKIENDIFDESALLQERLKNQAIRQSEKKRLNILFQPLLELSLARAKGIDDLKYAAILGDVQDVTREVMPSVFRFEDCFTINLSKKENMTTESIENAEETVEASQASGPIGPDGLPLTLVEEREDIINATRKYNPNDGRYAGHGGTQDAHKALFMLMAKLTPDQLKNFSKPNFLVDKERTLDFISTLKAGDVLGMNTDMYKLTSIKNKKLTAIKRTIIGNKFAFPEGNEEIITPKQIDMAFNTASCEILYRDDAPYGMEPELSYKVNVKVYADSKGRTYIFRTGKDLGKTSPGALPGASETVAENAPPALNEEEESTEKE